MEFIAYLKEYRIAVGKPCMHAIWPSQFKAHYQGSKHQWKVQRVRNLVTAIDEASLDLIQYLMKFEVLDYVGSAASELNICTDELMCQLDAESCLYICRVSKNMRTHCKQKHE